MVNLGPDLDFLITRFLRSVFIHHWSHGNIRGQYNWVCTYPSAMCAWLNFDTGFCKNFRHLAHISEFLIQRIRSINSGVHKLVQQWLQPIGIAWGRRCNAIRRGRTMYTDLFYHWSFIYQRTRTLQRLWKPWSPPLLVRADPDFVHRTPRLMICHIQLSTMRT